ncbi:hypothetical protein C4K14_4043 [Pseudomonas chlororaphis subsp. aureofaciens]|uniref:hypothetical protein n=1 Tax=Pseudomonas chlororaphis TaxID=587753 RepID=UPI000F6F6B46|nr:hypothetical protein [Pseudomonas chlororaphis]AZD86865.1 hypothetical protein C4K14_4043 [Pseudomonas chlororaphis subsp. aureofaciens]
MHYILVNQQTVPCDDVSKWALWYSTADCIVAEEWIFDVRVSTVFLGLNQGSPSLPILFETMVFLEGESSEAARYARWEDAEAGHHKLMTLLRTEMESSAVTARDAWGKIVERLRGDSKP